MLGMFGLIVNPLWDNGHGCGKKYTVKWIGAHCIGKSVTVKIFDHCLGCPFYFYISPATFAEIADLAAEIININYSPSLRYECILICCQFSGP